MLGIIITDLIILISSLSIQRDGLIRSAGDRAKRIENGDVHNIILHPFYLYQNQFIYLFIALFHFHESLQVFSQREYPAQFVLICIFMAQLFRERTYIMMDGRSYIVKNGLVCYSIIILAFNIQTLHYISVLSEFAGGIYSIWDRPTSASDAYIHHAKCPAR